MRYLGQRTKTSALFALLAIAAACSSSETSNTPLLEDSGLGGSGGSAAGSGGAVGGGGTSLGGQGGGLSGQGGTSQGGSGGTIPDSGTGGTGNTAGSTNDGGIIPGLGPAPVEINSTFQIDSTEVTRDQYAQWLATNPNPASGQPKECKQNKSYTPDCEWPPGTKGSYPVVCVDWCDARAFCAAGGKRLCGKIGGGATPYDSFKDAAVDQWFQACSSGGKTAYPYGDTYAEKACNGVDAAIGGSWGVGTSSACQSVLSGYLGVLDLSGNVIEWQDSCEDSGETAYCRTRGGSYNSGEKDLTCADGNGHMRDDRLPLLGFRCCSL